METTKTDKFKTNRNWIVAIALIVVFFAVREWNHQRKENDLVSSISEYTGAVKFEKLKNGALISTNTSLKLSSEKQVRDLASAINDTVKQMLEDFKSINNVTYVTNKFYAGKDTLRFETKIPCDFEPFKVRKGTPKTYRLVQTIGNSFVSVDTLEIADSITLVHGRKKLGFMKHDYSVDIHHSNPYMITTTIKDYKYVPEKKWYEKTWVHLIAGAVIWKGVSLGGNAIIKTVIK